MENRTPVKTVVTTQELLGHHIHAGVFGTSGRLPSERALAQRFQVSRATMRRALQGLADQGIVTSAPQSGWFFRDARLGEPPRTLISFTEMARRRGVIPRTKVLSQVVRDATLNEAQELATPLLSPVLDIERLRALGETPICIDRCIVVLDRAPGLDSVELENRSLYEEMTRLGARPARSDFAVEAVGANEREATLLEVSVGSPLLLGAETCFDTVGRPLLVGSTRYRANAYRFYATMLRR